MKRRFFNFSRFVFCLLILQVTTNLQTKAQQPETEFTAEGTVIAYQQNQRCPGCKSGGGIASAHEYWIVRIDDWQNSTERTERFILVEFYIYARSPTVDEINSSKLRFVLREPREGENADCIGEVIMSGKAKGKSYYRSRPADIFDYERTPLGDSESIPELKSLPCFVTYHPPKVVE